MFLKSEEGAFAMLSTNIDTLAAAMRGQIAETPVSDFGSGGCGRDLHHG